MNSFIPSDFVFHVECIEGNGDLNRRITFANVRELKASMKHFFERAVRNMEVLDIFVRQANRLKFVYPLDDRQHRGTNLRKVLVNESKDQLRDMVKLLRSNRPVSGDLAKGTYKFFGELFNIGIIFPENLLREIKQLKPLITKSSISRECLILLIDTVMAKIVDTPADNTSTHKQLLEAIVKPEYRQMPTQTEHAQRIHRTSNSQESTSGYSSSDSEESLHSAEIDAPANPDPLAQKTPEDFEILRHCEAIFHDLQAENIKCKSLELLTLMHQNPKKVEMVTSILTNTATSVTGKSTIYVFLIKGLETASEESKKYFDTMTAYIEKTLIAAFTGNCLVNGEPSDEENVKNIQKLRFLCELYHCSVVKMSGIFEVISGLLKTEYESNAAVNFLVKIMTVIGARLETENFNRIEKYFAFFKYTVDNSETTRFRRKEYTKLIAFRNNGWKDPKAIPESSPEVKPEKLLTFTLQFDDLDNDANFFGIALKARGFLRTEEDVKTLVKALLGHSTTDFKRIAAIASLIKTFSEIQLHSFSTAMPINLKEIIGDSLHKEYLETMALEVLDCNTKKRLTRLVVMAIELFQRNMISATDLALWLFHKHLHQLPLFVLSQVGSMVSSHPEAIDNECLSMAVHSLETAIAETTASTIADMHADLSKFSDLVGGRIRADRQPQA